jgi:ribosomal protein S18 acetylase RimI-like enzyme
MVRVRQLARKDYSEFRRMAHQLYREDPADKQMTPQKVSRTVNQLRNNPAKGRILIFEAEGRVVGYAILIFYWSNEYGGDILHIDELYVKPEHRGRGIATTFLKQLHNKSHAVAFELEVTPPNKEALQYYKRLGFKETKNLHLMRPS